jgi:hypothetical protein
MAAVSMTGLRPKRRCRSVPGKAAMNDAAVITPAGREANAFPPYERAATVLVESIMNMIETWGAGT